MADGPPNELHVFHHVVADDPVLRGQLTHLGRELMATKEAVLAKLEELKQAHDQQEARANAAMAKLQTTADGLQEQLNNLQNTGADVPVEIVEGLQALVDDINNDFIPTDALTVPSPVDVTPVTGGEVPVATGPVGGDAGGMTPSSDPGMTATTGPVTNDETAVPPGTDITTPQ